MSKRLFILAHQQARERAAQYCMDAPEGDFARFGPPQRNLEQNAKFHAICGDVASQREFAGKKRPLEAWKVLFISGHAVATKEQAEVVPGLEGEFINIRESSASMSVKRMASLIEYTLAWCSQNAVTLSDEARVQA